jgi:hypothetical protein
VLRDKYISFKVFAWFFTEGIFPYSCSAIVNNFFMTDVIYDQVNEAMVAYESMLPAEQVDTFYDTMVKSMLNPFTLIFSNTLDNLLVGGFVGIFVCSLTIRRPDIFATPAPTEESEPTEEEKNE